MWAAAHVTQIQNQTHLDPLPVSQLNPFANSTQEFEPAHEFVYMQALIATLLEECVGALNPDAWACEESLHGLPEPYREGPGCARTVMAADLSWE